MIGWWLSRVALVAGLLGVAYTVALGIDDPALRTARDLGVLVGILWVYHAPIVVALTWPFLFWRHPAGIRPGLRETLAFAFVVAIGLAGLNAMLRFTPSYAMWRGDVAFLSVTGLLGLLVFGGSIPVAMWLSWRPRSRRVRTAVAAAMVLAWAVAVAFALRAERTPAPPLEALPVPLANAAPPPAAWDRPSERPPVLLLGLDGLSWHVLASLFADGELPNLAMLAREGARAAPSSQLPNLSPSLWSTLATGRGRFAHGIHGFSVFQLPGMAAALSAGPTLGSNNWWNGWNRWLSVAGSRGWIAQVPVGHGHRQVAAVWDVAARYGLRTGVVKWYATWPVRDLGEGHFMVSDFSGRPGSASTPDSVRSVLEREPAPAADFEPDSPFRKDPWLAGYARQQNDWMGRAIDLHAAIQPDLGLYYAHFTDSVQHLYWRGDERSTLWYRPDLAHYRRFPPQVVDAYRLADRWLGDLLSRLAPATRVIVVSDHGFAFDGHEHHRGPPGVLLMAGPGIRAGTVARESSILDLAPTVLALLGLPISDELEGRVLEELLDPSGVVLRRQTESYDWFEPGATEAARSPEIEQEILERMKALGYVN